MIRAYLGVALALYILSQYSTGAGLLLLAQAMAWAVWWSWRKVNERDQVRTA